jgi:uncharacterized membrane protein
MRGESVVTSLKRRRKPRESMLDAAVAIVAVLSLVAVLSGLLVPVDGESYTDLAVLTENGSDDLLAGEYPTELEPNEEAPLVAAIENHENRRTNYTLVVELQRVERGDESLAVRERQELLQERASLDHGEQWHVEHEVAPELTGENLRLQYRLYRGSATDDATPYREVHLWLSVAED